MLLRRVLRAVLVPEHLVGHAHERVEAHVDLGLARRRHLVVVNLDLHAAGFEVQHHLRPQVLVVVGGRDREVALLVAGPVPEVRALRRPLPAGVPERRLGVEVVEAEVVALVEADVLQDEELELGPDVDGVGDPGALEVGLGLLGHVAGIARVARAGDRVLDVADQDQGRHAGERIDHRGVGVREEQHVGLVDRLEAADGGSVEADPFLEEVFIQLRGGDREVLPETRHVDEAQVDDLDALRLRQLEDVARCHSASFRQCFSSSRRCLCWRRR